jgi:hypothetical protein
MHIAEYLGRAQNAEKSLVKTFQKLAKIHAFDADVVEMLEKFSLWSTQHLEFIDRLSTEFGSDSNDKPEDVSDVLFSKPHIGGFGLLQDLHGLSLLVHEAQMCWTILSQGAKSLRNSEMESMCTQCGGDLKKETMWLTTKIKSAAPQALVVA